MPALPTASAYSESSFWEKLRYYARRAGREVVEKALWLHLAAQDEKTPVWARTTMYGALAYFILPADAVPDFLPAVGYTDDLGAIAAALAAVAVYITPSVKQKAAAQASRWFGEPEQHSVEG